MNPLFVVAHRGCGFCTWARLGKIYCCDTIHTKYGITFPDLSSLNIQYDLAQRATNVFDGSGRGFQLTHNNQGLVTRVGSVYVTLWSAVLDAVNRPYVVTDANGVTETNQFDALNELLKRTWPDGISEGFGWSAAGDRKSVV